MNITRGVQKGAQKVVVYGVEGIGKSTLASKFPDPLFIDTEGSTRHLDVARLEPPGSWSMLLQQVREVTSERPCRTLVVDTADWAERLCIEHVVASANNPKVTSIEDFGYGQGYTKLVEEFGRLLDLLTAATRAGINVVLVAHADIRKFEQPDEAASYDRWELKLSKSGQKKVAPLLKEWADAVLFLNYETVVETVSSGMGAAKGKARGGTKRVMYCNHDACWDAKNRWGLGDRLPLDYAQIAPHVPATDATSAPARPDPAPTHDVVAKAMKADAELRRIRAEIDGKGDARAAPAEGPAPDAPLHELEGLPAFWEPALQLMRACGVTVGQVREISVAQGNFTPDTPVANYPEEYVTGFIVPNFDKVRERAQELAGRQDDIPF